MPQTDDDSPWMTGGLHKLRNWLCSRNATASTRPFTAADQLELNLSVKKKKKASEDRATVRTILFLIFILVALWPVTPGPDGRRWSQRAALHVRSQLPHGERHRQELGRHEAFMGLHLRPREAQHWLPQLQDPADGAAHEPHQEPREDHRGGPTSLHEKSLLL